MSTAIFTFDTTHHALWAEEIARDLGIGHEVIAAPAAARARCSIAIQILPEDVLKFEAALSKSGIDSRMHVP
jgi:hypothetical protein